MKRVFTKENIQKLVRLKMDSCSASLNVPDKIEELLDKYRHLKDAKKEAKSRQKQMRKTLDGDADDAFAQIAEIESDIALIDENIEQNKNEIDQEVAAYSEDFLRRIKKKQNVTLRSFLLWEKTTFCANDFDSDIIMSLIKYDIRLHYKRIPADRNTIIMQLKGILDNGMPKYIVRADVKSCFENVPFKEVIDKLEREGYVSNTSMWYLKNIYKQTSGLGMFGVPRGLSFSSDLVEIFFQNVDREIKCLPGVYFYKRYVDDIIIVLSGDIPSPGKIHNNSLEYNWIVLTEIFSKYGLTLHEGDGKKKLAYVDNLSKETFCYLGYKFCIKDGGLSVSMSDDKIRKYEKAIEKVIEHYNLTACDNESLISPQDDRRRKREQPLRRLFGQLSALTGNGKLSGVKSNILTGIYYSNQHLTSTADLRRLDKFLKERIDRVLIIPDKLFKYNADSDAKKTLSDIKKVLKRWSFEEGFSKRRFCNNARFCRRMKEIKNLCR